MFILSGIDNKKMKDTWNTHRIGIVGLNIYFHNIRALRQRTFKYITEETYKEYFRGILHDVELESSPIDTIIPNDKEEQEVYESMFSINTEIPEYKRVSNRITLDDIYSTLPATNDTHVKMKEHPEELPKLVEEIFVFYVIENYEYFIDQGHLEVLTNMKDMLEYVVNNVTAAKIKSFIHTNRINFEKYESKLKDAVLYPEYKRTKIFYEDPHDDIPVIDVEKIMGILFTNVDTETDLVITTAIYMILSYAMPDIANNTPETYNQMPHVKYIKEVLAKIC